MAEKSRVVLMVASRKQRERIRVMQECLDFSSPFTFHPGPSLWDGAMHIQDGFPPALERPSQKHSEVCLT